ncbi:hypothetical protein ACFO3J_24965 [Streptomyces polygonati]|uniref:Uncharacterized protein n=1 Tax=Streptomyces polygonati TaxID=1617087 RepID=A0ABV8HRL0_9ACTN
MTSAALDALLADAAVPTSSCGFDVAAGLRRLAAEAATGSPTPEVLRAAQAGQRLGIMCRWVLNTPGAAAHVDRLVQEPPEDRGSTEDSITILPAAERHFLEDRLDIQGAVVFACLLHLTRQPESAQFWWQLAAGAGNRIAAYCLHLHHLVLGETRESQHWYHQVTWAIEEAADTAPDGDFLEGLGTVALYVRRNGSAASAPPPGSLEVEVDRLASRHPSGIVSRPDRRLADRLHDFSSRH